MQPGYLENGPALADAGQRRERLSLEAKLLRFYLRTPLRRGRSRVILFLARRLKSLWAIPISITGRPSIYVDLRFYYAHLILRDSPYDVLPHEIAEQHVMRRILKAGDVAFDVGVHFGFHTTLMSRLVAQDGRVCAFEPNEQLFWSLKRTIRELPNVTLYPLGLSDSHRDAVLFVPQADVSTASLAKWRSGSERTDLINCELRRLDDLVEHGEAPLPDFIKCDVEGAELGVFRGARRTLDTPDAPVVLFESNDAAARAFGYPASAAIEFLADLEHAGYRFFDILGEGWLRRIDRVDKAVTNILAVPRSRYMRWPELAIHDELKI
jgi:FkbM family methyltransferase